MKSISSDGGKVKSNGGGDLITNTLLANSNIQYNALILKQSATSGEVDFNSLYGVRLNHQDSLARINLLAIIQAGSDPKTSGSVTKTFHIDNDGNFLIQNGAFGVSQRFPKLKDTTDYDYVITVGQNNVAAIKNSKANTLTGCGYLLADQSTITTAATGYTLAYNPTTRKVSFWNNTLWQDLMIDTSSLSYVDPDQKANVDTKTLKVGAQSYDTTAKKPCWWNGTEWTDAMGSSIT
ncbi:hypothetical protein COMNV_01479 [Commensalibacter sp. Nvir]|nr:hypothetical protein COMNV_01479 [Commensalibacter sp. Nvir]